MDSSVTLDLTNMLIIVGAGVVAGFLNTVAGGGSLITLPLLITMGLPSAVANATNRVAIVGQNIFAVAGYKSKGISAFPYSLYLGLSALVGAVIGAKIAVDIDDILFNRILSVVMIIVVIFIVIRPMMQKSKDLVEKTALKNKVIGVISFFGVGIYGGFIQAGVGFIMLALLTSINGFSLVKSNSAKVFVALVYTIAALVVFILEDVIHWGFGLTLALGNSIGAWIGSRWSVAKGDVWIRRVLVVAVIGLAIKLWFYSN